MRRERNRERKNEKRKNEKRQRGREREKARMMRTSEDGLKKKDKGWLTSKKRKG